MATATRKELNKVGFSPARAKVLAAGMTGQTLKTLTRGAPKFSIYKARALLLPTRTVAILIKQGKFTAAQARLILKV